MKNKLKVAIICVLPLDPLREVLGLTKVHPVVAPWVTSLISILRLRDDIEVNVISYAPSWKKGYYFTHENVNYYLVRKFLPPLQKIISFGGKFFDFLNRKALLFTAKKTVNKINPDIVNLIGTEHPICEVILNIDRPSVVSIQGFIFLADKFTADKNIYKKQLDIETSIFKSKRNFVVQCNFMPDLISQFNPAANFYFCQYPFVKPVSDIVGKTTKNDILFAARVTQHKGIEDFLLTLKMLKVRFPDFSARIVGKPESIAYENKVKSLIKEYELENNITYLGYLQNYSDLYSVMAESKVYVLPTYHDAIPSSVIESMYLGTPVIAYNVGGLPDLNKEQENCLLVEKGDIEGLVEKIMLVLGDQDLRKKLVSNGQNFVNQEFDDKKLADNLVGIYNSILLKISQ